MAGTKSAWSDVKDFKWLRAQQSPHWALLPEAERAAAEATPEPTASAAAPAAASDAGAEGTGEADEGEDEI